MPSRPSRPILGNVLVMANAKQQTVTLVASDEVLGMESHFSAKVETAGSLTLPKFWGDIVSRLPNEAIRIETDAYEMALVPPEFVSSKIEGERSGGQHDGQATTEAWNSRG